MKTSVRSSSRLARPRVALLGSVALAAGLLAAPTLTPARADTAPITTNACLDSVPDLGSTTVQKICYTLFQPAGASVNHPVPLIFHSHGWGGSRITTASSFTSFLTGGFGVLSFDQRGFGQSGGTARVENPDYEGKDVEKLVAMASTLPWVIQDAPGDPRLGAIGGSYGGGYQFVGAFSEMTNRVDKKPVFDALAPEITWWDLKGSLAPAEVTRTEWTSLLVAAGANALPKEVLAGTALAAATGFWPKGQVAGTPNLDAFFLKNGPKWQVSQGRVLDIPVLFGQGETDTLFPLHQGLLNFQNALTDNARAKSIFVGYNGGHVLPAVFPQALTNSGDPCSKELGGGSFSDLTVRFFQKALLGVDTGLTGYGQYHLATAGNTCTTVDSVTSNTDIALALPVATTTTVGGPVGTLIAAGPIRVAGSPTFTANMFAAGVNNRAFYSLGVGTSPADVKIVQNNVLPVNELLPVNGDLKTVELPSVAVDVPKGMSLYLVATPVSDSFAAMGSRTPGAIVLQNVVVHLPVVPAAR